MAVKPEILSPWEHSLSVRYPERFYAGKKYEKKIINEIIKFGISPEKIKKRVPVETLGGEGKGDIDILLDNRIGIEVKLERGLGGYWDASSNRLIYYKWLRAYPQPVPRDHSDLIEKYLSICPIFVLMSDAPVTPYSPYHFRTNRKDVYVCKDTDLKKLLEKLIPSSQRYHF